MPLNIDLFQILLHILNFVILAGGLALLLFKPVNKFLDERQKHYEKLKSDNEIAQLEYEKQKAELDARIADVENELREKRLAAEKEITAAAKTTIDEAKVKASVILSSAEKEAETRKEVILESAQTEIGELVVSATQKLLGNTTSDKRDSELYDEFIKLAEKNGTGKGK